MEHFFERGAEFEADMWIDEGFGRFAGDAGMELLGPRWRSPTLGGEGESLPACVRAIAIGAKRSPGDRELQATALDEQQAFAGA